MDGPTLNPVKVTSADQPPVLPQYVMRMQSGTLQ